MLAELDPLGPAATNYSPVGIRFEAPEGAGRTPNVEAEPAHGKGLFEVQDQGSQIAALLADARPGHEVLDLCAGAGGKTLALAAAMKGEGHLIAHDSDKTRLRPIFERLTRSGAKNVEVLAPAIPTRSPAWRRASTASSSMRRARGAAPGGGGPMRSGA